MSKKIEDNIKKICRACGKEKPIKSFHRNNAIPSGYDSRCKICKSQGILIRNKKPKKIQKGFQGLMLFNTRDTDYREMYLFLEMIGYDLKRDIHIQFCEKYNLQPRERPKKSENFFSLEDLF